jgi:hypothetical protein
LAQAIKIIKQTPPEPKRYREWGLDFYNTIMLSVGVAVSRDGTYTRKFGIYHGLMIVVTL